MFDPNAQYQMGGTNYYQGMNQPMTKFNNPLTAEQIQQLMKKDAQFSLAITNEEMLRGICNHRNAEGTGDTLVYDSLTGEARCTICGYQFKPIEPNVSIEDIKLDVERIVDILQTIKLMYIDLPAEAASEYFPIIPLIEKIPQLFEFAAKNMNKHETYNWQYNNRNMGAVNMFNNLQNFFGGMAYNPGMNQPQQPMMTPQPMGSAGFAQPNAFGYPGASTPGAMPNPAFNPGGYAPQGGFQYVPGATPAPAVAPTVPSTDTTAADTTVTQTVNV